MKCVVTVPGIGQSYDGAFDRLRALGVQVDWKREQVGNTKDQEAVARHCRGYDLVIAANEAWGETALRACKRDLKLLVRYGIGYDSVDVAVATRAGIPVTILPGCNAESVAEHTVTLMLSAARNVTRLDRLVKGGLYTAQQNITKGIHGKTVGMLGYGNIAKAAIRMLRGFGCRFLAYDTMVDLDFAREYGVRYVTREALLRESDVVSVHLPLTPETRWTIDRDAIALMKPDAILINTSRGGLVRSDDLAQALREDRLYAAGLDVFENEVGSNQALGYQFLDLDNVVLTPPHTASSTTETFLHMMDMAVDNIERYLRGEPLEGLLNPEVLAKAN